MTRSKRKGTLLLGLVELACCPAGGGFSAQAFITPPPGRCVSMYVTCSRIKQHQLKFGTLRRPRGDASQVSQGLFPSVARTPFLPGEVYEGEKNEKEKREQTEFNTNLGKVIETLREDYVTMLDEPLNFEIYTPDLQLRDPSGVVLTGLPAYKRMFATFRFARRALVHDVSTVFRLSYDGSRQQVRVTWHFVLDATPVVARPMHLDGTSVYSLSTEGLVRRHDVETIIFNGTPVKPPFAQAWMKLPSWATQGRGANVAGAPGLTTSSSGSGGGNMVSRSSSSDSIVKGGSSTGHRAYGGRNIDVSGSGRSSRRRSSSGDRRLPITLSGFGGTALAFQGLSAVATAVDIEISSMLAAFVGDADGSSSSSGGIGGVIWKASSEGTGGGRADSAGERASSSGGKRGGPGRGKQDKDDRSSSDGTKNNEQKGKKKQQKKKKKGLWPIDYNGPLACETSFDCTGGYVCCDLIVVKICCSNGVMQRKPGDLIPSMIPIPGRGRTELDQCQNQLAQ